MPDNLSAILGTSKDPGQLTEAAVTLAHSENRDDHRQLLASLESQEFLLRLDSREAYLGWVKSLNIRQVLDELSNGKPQPAHATLLTLTRSEVFVGSAARVDLLIVACAPIRPAPPELVKFWDAHCQPQDGFGNLTVEALVDNGSAPAIALLAAKMRDTRFEEEEKLNWMRSSILTHRNDALLLNACHDVLRAGLSGPLRVPLVEVLFDYKPQEWFAPATVLCPPSRAALGLEGGAVLEKVGEFALANLKPPEDLAAKIRSELEAWRRKGNSP
ncbi:MAG TPA: hypothetical protein VNZ64_05240 [Candidatus Acidoferrum sp.]|jgi:hypothetical protein|nr:hypothetical protein [Candidatus Acidoferrum sp.]